MRLPKTLIDELDIRAAAEKETTSPPDLLPSRVAERAVASHIDEYASLVRGLAATSIPIESAEVIAARKSSRGLRPVSALSLTDRVVYRALVDLLGRDLPPLRRSHEDFDEFKNGPLDADGTNYVAMADVASFYQFIDHDLLANELIAQTGHSPAVDAVSTFLHRVMDRRFGLPQSSQPSDLLAEAVIDIAERRLLRQQLPVWRFNDDFRLASDSWRGAQQRIERLDLELRRLGLSLNDEKIHTWTIDTYREYVNGPDRRWKEIADAVEVDLAEVSLYSDHEPEATNEGVVVAASAEALDIWKASIEEPSENPPLQKMINRRLLSLALALLDVFEAPDGLDYCRDILFRDPWLTPRVSKYMASLTRSGNADALPVLEAIVQDPGIYLYPWQSLWLFDIPIESANTTPSITSWVRSHLDNSYPATVRARASYALATCP